MSAGSTPMPTLPAGPAIARSRSAGLSRVTVTWAVDQQATELCVL